VTIGASCGQLHIEEPDRIGNGMAKFDRYYIVAAAAYLVLGIGLGIGMGVTESFQYVALHAHLNLVGWASLCLYGLVLRSFPELQNSKLARPQFVIANLGAISFLPGVGLALANVTHALVIVGALIWLAGALFFLVMTLGLLRGTDKRAHGGT
jgi:hypothetical protein